MFNNGIETLVVADRPATTKEYKRIRVDKGPYVPKDVFDEAVYANRFAYNMHGDPLPGRSALDKKCPKGRRPYLHQFATDNNLRRGDGMRRNAKLITSYPGPEIRVRKIEDSGNGALHSTRMVRQGWGDLATS